MSFQKPYTTSAGIPDLARRSAVADTALPRRTVLRLLSAGTMALALPFIRPAAAQNAVKLKLSHWIPASHPMSVWIQKWSDELKAASGGNIDIEIYPNSQLGPVQDHYDMVRRGTVDIGWTLHSTTGDRFPLTTLSDIPYLAETSVMGTKIMNNPELREKYFDPEARGVKNLILFTNQPANIHTAAKPVRSPADLVGQRIRFPSAPARRFLDELGATPVGLPPTAIAENLQKGVVDGVMIDYGGAGIAFKLGGLVKHTAEIRAYLTSFALMMNPASYAKLTGKNKEIFDKSLIGREEEIGKAWDSIDAPGKKALMEGGMTPFVPTESELAPFRAAGQRVGSSILAERDKAGHPASAVYAKMKEIAGGLKTAK